MKRFLQLVLPVLLLPFLAGLSTAVDPPATQPPQEQTVPAAPLPPPALNGPSVQVPETHFDFGQVREGEDYVHNFKIRNVGNAPLEVKKVLPG